MLKGIGEGATYFYHPDHLGSVSVVSNHKGVPYERVEYLPFGEVWIEDVDAATRYIPFRFTSKELDRETGLYYYGARYYEPKVSRWMSADPAGFALVNPMGSDGEPKSSYSVVEAVNWYAYVSNNPVKYVDPRGMREEDPATLAAMANFSNQNIPGYTDVTEKFSDITSQYEESGLDFRIFYNEKKDDYVVAFRGLNPVSGEDWDTALGQALQGKTEGQFDDAKNLVGKLLEQGGIEKSNLTLTGNSLGGGQAGYVGSHLGIKTITFNAAGVHPNNVGLHADMVTNYFMSGDILTTQQEKRPWLPSAIGDQKMVNPTPFDDLIATSLGPVIGGYYLHYIGKMERALEKEKSK